MDPTEFAERLASLRETRARLPEVVRNRHATRRRRAVAGHTARLLLVEADLPASGLLATPDDPIGLADRGELLRRLVIALEHPRVDGVIAAADVLDDLALLEVVERKLLVASMNRRGPGGVVVGAERFPGHDPESIAGSHLDGGSMVLAIDPDDPRTATALDACGRAVTGLSGATVLALVAPMWCRRDGDVISEDLSVESVIRAASVASGIGARSAFTWLVLPPIDGLASVTRSVTMPVLVRADGPVSEGRAAWRAALAAPGTRGVVLSGASLYSGDAAEAVDAVVELVHGADDA